MKPDYSGVHAERRSPGILGRDLACVRGLIYLGGLERDVGIGQLRDHVLAHGYRGVGGGESGSDIAFACRWLADDGKVIESGMAITRPRWGFYRVERRG